MVQLEEARALLQKQVNPIMETEMILIWNAVGRVLAEDIIAEEDQPPFSRSPLDGYAVRGNDTIGASKANPKSFQVIGTVFAGEVFDGMVQKEEAVRIMTGAPIPNGADTVIRQEDSDYGIDQVCLYGESKPYENYCPKGEDYKKGTVLLKKGITLDAISISILASTGKDQVMVYRKAKVAIISTGDEIIQPGQRRKPGKIYDSNLLFLYSRLTELGIQPVIYEHCEDDPEKMAKKIEQLAEKTDLLITTGGVSVGQKDIMHEVITKLHAKQIFWKVNLKPGAPTLAAVYKHLLMICLSGNPFGAVANFELLVRLVMKQLTGNTKWDGTVQRAILQNDYSKCGKTRRFLRGYAEDGKVWIPSGNHASGVVASMRGCNCLIELQAEQAKAEKGDVVWIHLF